MRASPACLRIVLLHDPAAFKHLPTGEGELALSGHTYGGHGLVSAPAGAADPLDEHPRAALGLGFRF